MARSSTKSKTTPEKIQTKYRCSKCGTEYVSQNTNFASSQSILYAGNNYRIDICNNCLNDLMKYYTNLYENEDKALKRVCLHYDLYYSEDVLKVAKVKNPSASLIKNYISKLNMKQHDCRGKTFDTYLDENENIISSKEDFQEMKENGEANVSQASFARWGAGLPAEDYSALDSHYKMLLKQFPDGVNFKQDTLLKMLCQTNLQMEKVWKDGNIDKYEKLVKLYQSTLSRDEIKNDIEKVIDTETDTFGCWLSDIENYCPAEYYQDKNKYKDAFKIGEYIKRFLFRPMKNYFTGSREMDYEFAIEDDDDA